MLKAGDKAPDFSVENADGVVKTLGTYKDKKIIIYFYPKDNTSGCTKEACSFRDGYEEFVKRGYTIIGVSPDNAGSHNKFREKYGLQFELLVDNEHRMCESYGVWAEKSMYGKKYFGVLRTTFVIDGDGTILKVYDKVKPENHAAEILSGL